MEVAMKKEKINANDMGSVAKTTYNINNPVVIEILKPALLLISSKQAQHHFVSNPFEEIRY